MLMTFSGAKLASTLESRMVSRFGRRTQFFKETSRETDHDNSPRFLLGANNAEHSSMHSLPAVS
jgi:hypothetical protein